ncbi:hypothetical protein MTO96_006645 [Rhipicephalus appendiculatus]
MQGFLSAHTALHRKKHFCMHNSQLSQTQLLNTNVILKKITKPQRHCNYIGCRQNKITTFSTGITCTQKARLMNMAEFFDKFPCKDCLVKNSNKCEASMHSSALHRLHTPAHSQTCRAFMKMWQYSTTSAPLLFQ